MADTKVCNKCKEEKTLDNFSPNKDKPQGVQYACKVCNAIAAKNRRLVIKLSPDKIILARERSSRWRKDNPDRARRIKALSNRKRPYVKAASSAKYRASKIKATPRWLTKEQKLQIDIFYQLKSDLLCVTGEIYHVDHIVPLKGINVCGLHVPWNLQILPADINCSKSNTYNGW